MVYDFLNDGIILRVRLLPNSSSCRLNGIFKDAQGASFLKICVTAVPEKGKANKELLALLAKELKVSKSQCDIISGELDRYKKIKITADVDLLKARLETWLKGQKDDSTNY